MRGVAGSSIELIIRPTAHRFDMPIHTTDAGFARHAGVLERRLRQPGEEDE